VLRFDRYLAMRARALDLASGRIVEMESSRVPRATIPLFQSRQARTLIDFEAVGGRRIEVWERWVPQARPERLEPELTNFNEVLECARAGRPRPFDLAGFRPTEREYLVRAFAREARVRGWIPIAVELLGALAARHPRKWPVWLVDRSLVIFTETPGLSGDATVALLRLAQRDTRPHVLVRSLSGGMTAPKWSIPSTRLGVPVVHEAVARFGRERTRGSTVDLQDEATARWALLVEELTGGRDRPRRAVELADVLVAREQPFEARALLAGVPPDTPEASGQASALIETMNREALARAQGCMTGAAGQARGWEMLDDLVGVLQLCQDTEDEQMTLARVGAFVRERLQASTVAFVVREGSASRVLARVGSEAAGIDVATRAIETGLPVSPPPDRGPTESASPVRHASEVIGAVWCRWSAGTTIAPQHASALLGVAAAAAAPSVRLALSRLQPATRPNQVPELIGDSAAMVAVRDAIVRAAASPFPVIIEGESGSGKELAARAIHARSPRRERRFCAINCAALVDDLVEAELFGHVRGAFTGASSDRPGMFEDASGGTLFLDEVAELTGRVQAKLLRTLQEGEIRRIGETLVRKVDVRLVAATNCSLAKEVEAGRFRADLWYRLDVIRITLPPLRERLEDLPGLVAQAWQALAGRTGSRAALAPATIAVLAAYDWPGNVRELQNVLASLLVSAPHTGMIRPSSLPVHVARAAAFERGTTLADARRQFEERYVRVALARAGGRTAAAARELGLSRQGLSKLMGRLGIAGARTESLRRTNVQ